MYRSTGAARAAGRSVPGTHALEHCLPGSRQLRCACRKRQGGVASLSLTASMGTRLLLLWEASRHHWQLSQPDTCLLLGTARAAWPSIGKMYSAVQWHLIATLLKREPQHVQCVQHLKPSICIVLSAHGFAVAYILAADALAERAAPQFLGLARHGWLGTVLSLPFDGKQARI